MPDWNDEEKRSFWLVGGLIAIIISLTFMMRTTSDLVGNLPDIAPAAGDYSAYTH